VGWRASEVAELVDTDERVVGGGGRGREREKCEQGECDCGCKTTRAAGAFADVAMVALVMGHFVLKRLNAALCGVSVSSAKVFEERGGSDCVEIVARSGRSERRP